MYSNEDLIKDCLELFRQTEGNKVDIPGIGETEVIGANYMGPYEWLPEAKSVISMFLPFSEAR